MCVFNYLFLGLKYFEERKKPTSTNRMQRERERERERRESKIYIYQLTSIAKSPPYSNQVFASTDGKIPDSNSPNPQKPPHTHTHTHTHTHIHTHTHAHTCAKRKYK